jgi:hypothetical protein
VREELQVERSPLRVPDHRLKGVLGRELGLLRGARDVIPAGGEALADVACAFGAAAVEELEEQLLLVGEVVVDGTAAVAGLFSHRVEAGCVEAIARENAGGSGQDLLAGFVSAFGLSLSLAFHA